MPATAYGRRTDAAFSEEATFTFLLGAWTSCSSSNVQTARYDEEEGRLEIGFGKPGGSLTYYYYPGVTLTEAKAFAAAPSKGGWVEDVLKKPGRPYVKM